MDRMTVYTEVTHGPWYLYEVPPETKMSKIKEGICDVARKAEDIFRKSNNCSFLCGEREVDPALTIAEVRLIDPNAGTRECPFRLVPKLVGLAFPK